MSSFRPEDESHHINTSQYELAEIQRLRALEAKKTAAPGDKAAANARFLEQLLANIAAEQESPAMHASTSASASARTAPTSNQPEKKVAPKYRTIKEFGRRSMMEPIATKSPRDRQTMGRAISSHPPISTSRNAHNKRVLPPSSLRSTHTQPNTPVPSHSSPNHNSTKFPIPTQSATLRPHFPTTSNNEMDPSSSSSSSTLSETVQKVAERRRARGGYDVWGESDRATTSTSGTTTATKESTWGESSKSKSNPWGSPAADRAHSTQAEVHEQSNIWGSNGAWGAPSADPSNPWSHTSDGDEDTIKAKGNDWDVLREIVEAKRHEIPVDEVDGSWAKALETDDGGWGDAAAGGWGGAASSSWAGASGEDTGAWSKPQTDAPNPWAPVPPTTSEEPMDTTPDQWVMVHDFAMDVDMVNDEENDEAMGEEPVSPIANHWQSPPAPHFIGKPVTAPVSPPSLYYNEFSNSLPAVYAAQAEPQVPVCTAPAINQAYVPESHQTKTTTHQKPSVYESYLAKRSRSAFEKSNREPSIFDLLGDAPAPKRRKISLEELIAPLSRPLEVEAPVDRVSLPYSIFGGSTDYLNRFVSAHNEKKRPIGEISSDPVTVHQGAEKPRLVSEEAPPTVPKRARLAISSESLQAAEVASTTTTEDTAPTSTANLEPTKSEITERKVVHKYQTYPPYAAPIVRKVPAHVTVAEPAHESSALRKATRGEKGHNLLRFVLMRGIIAERKSIRQRQKQAARSAEKAKIREQRQRFLDLQEKREAERALSTRRATTPGPPEITERRQFDTQKKRESPIAVEHADTPAPSTKAEDRPLFYIWSTISKFIFGQR